MSKKSLTKTQFLDEFADAVNHELELNIKRKQAGVIIDTLQDVLCDHATDEKGVKIPGFIKVAVVKTKAREGRNPSTGETVHIKSKIKGKVTLLKAMKERLADIGKDYFGKDKKKDKEKSKKDKKEKKNNIIVLKKKKEKEKTSKKKHKKAA